MSDLVIYTWGSGEIVKQVFDGIATLVKFVGGDYQTLLYIGLSIGLFAALLGAFSKGGLSALIKTWFIPAFLTISCFLAPISRVKIVDEMIKVDPKKKIQYVDNVPLLLAYTASFFSNLSFGVTKMLTGIFHTVNDKTYDWTGAVYGGQTMGNSKALEKIDGQTKENFRRFCYECVWRDLAMGNYSRDQLEEAPNLLKFLSENTSSLRGVMYRHPQTKGVSQTKVEGPIPSGPQTTEDSQKKDGLITCKDAIARIKAQVKGTVGSMPTSLKAILADKYKYLVDLSKNTPAVNLIEQQIAIEMIQNHTNPSESSLAGRRAELQQLESSKIFGFISPFRLIATRNFMELFLYLVFPIIIIVSLVFRSFSVLLNWAKTLCWISFWPPLYVLANFILTIVWNFKQEATHMNGLGLIMFSSEGLKHNYAHLESVACNIFASIPFLAYGLLYIGQGGASAFMHMTSGLNQAAQGSASMAASESISGNYSYGNVSLATRNLANTTEGQTNLGSSFRMGASFFNGTDSMTAGSGIFGSKILNVGQTSAGINLTSTDAYSSAITNQLVQGEALIKGETNALNTSIGKQMNVGENLSKFLGNTISENQGYSNQELSSFSKNWSAVNTQVDDYAKTHGITKDMAMKEICSASVGTGTWMPFFSGSAGVNFQNGCSQIESATKGARYSEASSIAESFQKISQTTQSESGLVGHDQGYKTLQDFNKTWTESKHSASSLSSLYQKQQSLQKTQSETKNVGDSASVSLNNAFNDYLGERYGGDSGMVREVYKSPKLLQREANAFLKEYTPHREVTPPKPVEDLRGQYQGDTNNLGSGVVTEVKGKLQEGVVRGQEIKENLMAEVPTKDNPLFRNAPFFQHLNNPKKIEQGPDLVNRVTGVVGKGPDLKKEIEDAKFGKTAVKNLVVVKAAKSVGGYVKKGFKYVGEKHLEEAHRAQDRRAAVSKFAIKTYKDIKNTVVSWFDSGKSDRSDGSDGSRE